MSLIKNIAHLFEYLGYKWSIEGRLDTPTEDDVDSLLDEMSGSLNTVDGSWIECGRLLVKNDGDHRDVYMHVGTINKENDNEH